MMIVRRQMEAGALHGEQRRVMVFKRVEQKVL